ncbi:hypothetical protein BKA57DRAFT_33143 [Linnemannia elongata]|nr:hypothetical protein BKA57DRAFT_33143 [Linnemannia elongata]
MAYQPIAKVKDKKDKRTNILWGNVPGPVFFFFSLSVFLLRVANLHPTHIALLQELIHVHEPLLASFFIAISLACRLSSSRRQCPVLTLPSSFLLSLAVAPRSLTLVFFSSLFL